MSLLHRFFGRRVRRGGLASARQVFIVDANGFIDKRYREAGGLPSPRDNFYVLKNLAYFVQREGVELKAVFVGRPLREAGEGQSFKGVSVYYAESEKALAQKIAELTHKCPAKSAVVVVTNDQQIERQAMKTSVPCMRLTTLKKGMEGNLDHDRQPRQNQPQRRVPPEPEQPDAEESVPVNKEEKPVKNVLDLIDPV